MLHWHAPCRAQLAIKARVVCFRASAQKGVRGAKGGKATKRGSKMQSNARPYKLCLGVATAAAAACVCVRAELQVAGGNPTQCAGKNVMVSKARDKYTWQPCVCANKSKSKLSFRARPRSVLPRPPALRLPLWRLHLCLFYCNCCNCTQQSCQTHQFLLSPLIFKLPSGIYLEKRTVYASPRLPKLSQLIYIHTYTYIYIFINRYIAKLCDQFSRIAGNQRLKRDAHFDLFMGTLKSCHAHKQGLSTAPKRLEEAGQRGQKRMRWQSKRGNKYMLLIMRQWQRPETQLC